MAPQQDWRIFLGVAAPYFVTLVFYRLFLHPLAQFPGPKLAAISRWYEGYYDVVLGGLYTSKIARLHKTYGAALRFFLLYVSIECGQTPIVKISPHELHINEPNFFSTLYRVDGRWDKYA